MKVIFINLVSVNFIRNKIYDVVRYKYNDDFFDSIVVIDERGLENAFYVYGKDVLYKDVTDKYRSDIIDGILK